MNHLKIVSTVQHQVTQYFSLPQNLNIKLQLCFHGKAEKYVTCMYFLDTVVETLVPTIANSNVTKNAFAFLISYPDDL